MKRVGSDKPPILRDVATVAGTSVATASRVLSGSNKVAEGTAERVREAARQLGFVLNHAKSAAARSRIALQDLRHGMVALVQNVGTSDNGVPFHFAATMEGIAEAARGANVTLTLCCLSSENLASGILPVGLTGVRVDGVLLHPSRGMDLSPFFQAPPTVLMGCRPARISPFPSVESDSATGIDALVDHLWRLGHRRLLFLSHHLLPPRPRIPYVDRRDAFLQSVHERGCDGEVVALPSDQPRNFAAQFQARPKADRPTALVASCDGMAVRLLAALAERGVRVPEEVSVTGYDGIPRGEDAHPRLTTWHVPWKDVGRMAFELLMRRIKNEPTPHKLLVGGELRVRGSTGPASE